MLSLKDCIDLCDLTDEEVAAIAEHEHIPEICAAEMGKYLVEQPDGTKAIRSIIIDDIAHAEAHGNRTHAIALKLVLKRFIEAHPEAA